MSIFFAVALALGGVVMKSSGFPCDIRPSYATDILFVWDEWRNKDQAKSSAMLAREDIAIQNFAKYIESSDFSANLINLFFSHSRMAEYTSRCLAPIVNYVFYDFTNPWRPFGGRKKTFCFAFRKADNVSHVNAAICRGLTAVEDSCVKPQLPAILWIVSAKHMKFEIAEGQIGAQFSSRGVSRLPQRPNKKPGANATDDQGPETILGGIASGIRSLPLGAQIGISIILAFIAPPILFRGGYRLADGPSYRISGPLLIGAALLLYAVLFWFAGVSAGYIAA